uniref:MARTX n=1 Tax=Ganoderma boninense TaxID=34458 RepID=A0A5K1JW52_9APHY|nr:MARTX [Ganoderma boninense]
MPRASSKVPMRARHAREALVYATPQVVSAYIWLHRAGTISRPLCFSPSPISAAAPPRQLSCAPNLNSNTAMSHKLSPSVSSVGSPLSAVGGGGSVLTALTAAPAEVAAAAEIIERMKGSLGSFGKTLDSLGEQTVQMIQVGGQAEIANSISRCVPVFTVHMQREF